MKFIKSTSTLFFAALMFFHSANGQNGVAIAASAATADVSAMLDVQSTTKGALVPRMTNAQRAAISTPANGLLVFCTDAPAGFYYNSGTSASPVWVILSAGALTGSGTTNYHAKWTSSNTLGNGLIFDNGTNVGVNTSGTPASLLSVGGTTGNFQVNSTGAIGTATGITSSGTITFSGLGSTAGVVLNSSAGVLSSTAGALPVANGGTGATSAAAALTSLGAAPSSGSANYIQNTTTQQASSNFNISGTGVVGGLITGNGGLITNGSYYSLYGGTAEIFANGDNHSGGGIAVSDDGGFYDFNNGPVTFLGSSGLIIAGSSGASSSGAYLRIASMASADGPVYADAIGQLQKHTACPSPYTTYTTGIVRLCFMTNSTARQWNDAEVYCNSQSGGDICTFMQLTRACNAGFLLNAYNNYWMGDHSSDDSFMYVNANTNFGNCSLDANNNFDGEHGRTNTGGVFCCIEYTSF